MPPFVLRQVIDASLILAGSESTSRRSVSTTIGQDVPFVSLLQRKWSSPDSAAQAHDGAKAPSSPKNILNRRPAKRKVANIISVLALKLELPDK